MKKFSFILLLISIAASAIAYTVSEKIIARSDNVEKRPEWVSDSKTIIEGQGKIEFIGMAELPIDSRVRAAYRVSDAQAKAEYAKYVSTKLTAITSVTETGFDIDDVSMSNLIQEASRVNVNRMQVKERYWERVIQVQDNEDEVGIIRLFSVIEVPTSEIKKAVNKAIKESEMPSKFKAEMEVLVVQEWADVK